MDFEKSPPSFGSSCMTGAVLRGQAYGNVLNHADFPKLGSGPVSFINNALVNYKVAVYLLYSDPVKIDVTPDPSLLPKTMFHVSTVPPLESAVVLKKVAQRLESVTSM